MSNPKQIIQSASYNVAQAAELLGVNRRKLTKLIEEDKIVAVCLGNKGRGKEYRVLGLNLLNFVGSATQNAPVDNDQ